MKTKILTVLFTIGLFALSTVQAQEKKDDSTKTTMEHGKMDLSKMAKTFVCPMHPEVTSDKADECPKCGMTLVEKKIEKEKMEMKKRSKVMKMDYSKMDLSKMAKTFVCPMHSEVTSDKEGECPKCGMTLVEKKMDHNKMEMKKMKKKNEEGAHSEHKH